MQKQYLAFFDKIGKLAVLVVLCFFMAGSCPLKKLIIDFGAAPTEMAPQAKPMVRAGSTLSCSIEQAVTRAAVLDIHKPSAKSLGAFLLFAVLFIVPGAIARVLHVARYRYVGRIASPVPLFLKNHTLLL